MGNYCIADAGMEGRPLCTDKESEHGPVPMEQPRLVRLIAEREITEEFYLKLRDFMSRELLLKVFNPDLTSVLREMSEALNGYRMVLYRRVDRETDKYRDSGELYRLATEQCVEYLTELSKRTPRERITLEKLAMNERIQKISKFINDNAEFAALNKETQVDLLYQDRVMRNYQRCLTDFTNYGDQTGGIPFIDAPHEDAEVPQPKE